MIYGYHFIFSALRYKPVRFTGDQARAIARGFAIAAEEGAYAIHTLAILPDHAHAIVGRHHHHVDRIAAHMKARATMQLNRERLRPFINNPRADGTLPSPWARKYWCRGLKPQKWNCIAEPQPV